MFNIFTRNKDKTSCNWKFTVATVFDECRRKIHILMQQGRLTSIPYLCLEIFSTVFFILFLVCCYACQTEKNILSAYSSLYFINMLILTLVTDFAIRFFYQRIFPHFPLAFIDWVYYLHKHGYSLCHYLCQMTNGSFGRSWIFNELLRSIDFIRIVRIMENSKIS